MADLYATYERGTVGSDDIDKMNILPMQMIHMTYEGSTNRRIVLALDVDDKKYFHCIKLSGMPLSYSINLFRSLLDTDLYDDYLRAHLRGDMENLLVTCGYRFPLTAPNYNKKAFYETRIKKNRSVKRYESYRTYLLEKVSDTKLLYPDLEYFGILPKINHENR